MLLPVFAVGPQRRRLGGVISRVAGLAQFIRDQLDRQLLPGRTSRGAA